MRWVIKPSTTVFAILLMVFGQLGCATNPASRAGTVAVEAPYAIWVRPEGNQSESVNQKIEAGQKYYWDRSVALWVEAPGRASVFLAPLTKESESIQLNIPQQKNWIDQTVQTQVNAALWQILPKLKRVEEFFAARKFSEALPIVAELKTQFPQVEYIRWVEAIALYNLGQKQQALVLFRELKDSSVYFSKPLEFWEVDRSPAAEKKVEKKAGKGP